MCIYFDSLASIVAYMRDNGVLLVTNANFSWCSVFCASYPVLPRQYSIFTSTDFFVFLLPLLISVDW